jgi:hypothetical protein
VKKIGEEHRSPEKKAAAWENKSAGNRRGRGKMNITLKAGSVYHVMKSICIIMSPWPEYIHVHQGGNIQRTPKKNTIIEKAIIHLKITKEFLRSTILYSTL